MCKGLQTYLFYVRRTEPAGLVRYKSTTLSSTEQVALA